MPYDGSLPCSADSACPPLQCVSAAAPSHRSAHYAAAFRPHEAEVQAVRPGTDAAELEVLDRILFKSVQISHGSEKHTYACMKYFNPLSRPTFLCDLLISTS